MILATTVIVSISCQENTNETNFDGILYSIINVPNRDTPCPEGQQKDQHGKCREVV